MTRLQFPSFRFLSHKVHQKNLFFYFFIVHSHEYMLWITCETKYDENLQSIERYYTQAVLLEYTEKFPICTICTLDRVPSLSFLNSEWTLYRAVEDSEHKLNTMLGITCTTLTVQLYSLVLRKIAIKGIMFPSF